jgi:hypothetical protein
MPEYIDVPNLILFLKCGEYESSEDIIKFIENNVTTDVVERVKINKAIDEIINLRMQYRNDDYYDCKHEVLEILKKI